MLRSFLQPFQRQRRAPFGRRAYSLPVPPNKKVQLKPLDYLQPEHESVQGVSKETALAFGARFSPRGIIRAVRYPRARYSGSLLAYCGLTVRDESPALIFPNGFISACTIFNAHHITKGELYLVRDPLQTLQAFETGVENVVELLTDGICPQQFEELSSLMDERKCDIAHLYQLPKGSFFFETALKIDVHNGPPCRIKTKRQEDSPLSVIPSRQPNPYEVAFRFTPSALF
jgi:hypothetical protein